MINLVSFGDTVRCSNTGERFKKQAVDMDIFDNIYILNEFDFDENFIKKNHHFIRYGSRGFGYWIWKPQVILQILEKMNEGDYLLYCDIGCSFNKNGKLRFLEYIKMTNEILCFKLFGCLTKEWTKMDTIKSVFPDTDINLNQILATSILFKKTHRVMNLVKEWVGISCCDNYHLVDDSPSILENDKNFKEHRHDQSIFDLIIKKSIYNDMLDVIILDDEIDVKHENFPIFASRLKF
jgi:hypothetical protein